jgi:flagellar basal-body rod protein FlgG
MNTSFYIASTGLRAYQNKLDNISNNIANIDTNGFKRREASFSENLALSIQNQPSAEKEIGRLSPLGIRTAFGSRIGLTALDVTQGAPKETHNPYDFMMEGNGFFQVQRGTGNTREILYTKGGTFQPTPAGGNRVRLANAQGDLLLDRNGNPVEWDKNMNFQVAPDGTIAGTNQQIGIVEVSNPQLLTGEGGVFRLAPRSNAAVNPSTASAIKQGFLESSNVDLNQEMTDMIKAQRGYQASARALSYADQMMGIANGIMRT